MIKRSYTKDWDELNPTKNLYVMKRHGARVKFDIHKIKEAIRKANISVPNYERLDEDAIQDIATQIATFAISTGRDLSVEEIQDKVENALMSTGKYTLARSYITYRYRHNENRELSELEKNILGIVDVSVNANGIVSNKNEAVTQENSNKNPIIVSTQRDYIAGEISRSITKTRIMSDKVKTAHVNGEIHVHDTDYEIQRMHNCCLINLEDMLMNGTEISGVHIDRPRSFITAATVASQIIAQVASQQYGGQTITLSHLAPFVDISRQKIKNRLTEELNKIGVDLSPDQLNQLVEAEVTKEMESGCQTIQYQLITLQTTNGQSPFVTIFMYLHEVPEGQIRDDLAKLIEIMLKQRILGVKDATGAYIAPAFPKLIYCLQEDNITEGSKYYNLTCLAAKCTAKRLVPDYISEKLMRKLKGDVYPCMGCRSFLTPDRFTDNNIKNIAHALNDKPNTHKYYGRFNQGVVTINLVDVACSSGKDEKKFWEILNERLDICHEALREKHKMLLGTPSDIAPIQWQAGALARLKSGEVIDPLLFNGYSTISLGYAGLAECVYYMKGIFHTSDIGKPFGLKVMQALNDACNTWKSQENIDYSVYGTPLESTTYKFAKALQRKFGKIPHVTDKNYITNSYHIHVTEEINAFDKLSKEAEFQRLSPGGAISYVEVPNMQNNIPAVLKIIQHIYHTILYAEINTKSDHCDECGYDGEIQVRKDDSGKFYWQCPQCGCTDQSKMHIARRTCGYIGTQYWNQGRTQEIAERVLHLSTVKE